ncbi:tRNA (adenosine(37)-N6)-dimethylallyltransferase MiaA [Companilactobacillus ginsenosidimutans]|uniref:tRNA dimethylallyltransferase n=1 Tax=Companilactobacillus ginsenosidimutans TaxID=1007676 RepID=A0A0H4QEC8_9LACO|nr:tRNA (adenosine(37)-N6)-dimethylallyltransferase MiaA [Companilactobacillus ginsenosidimutans]AKP66734.1 tRNA delta(2)-isopentenylpyrophosphate transferase [Companilactobacillus ginsenosidimutans]
MKKVVAIVGPTAVGKSALGLKLAKEFDGEIISGDSMQIYRGLDIGTAKDSKAELTEVPHHLVDICNVEERYTVKDFQKHAIKSLDEISSRSKVPFIVGGTGFYLNSLLRNLDLGGDSDTTPELRSKLLELEKSNGIDGLKKRLVSEDPESVKTIDMNNPRRLIRAIEVFETTGKSIVQQENGSEIAEFLLIGLTDDRQTLYNRINDRVDKMVELGLINEARTVFEQRSVIPQAKNGIGYKELFPYFEKQVSLDDSLTEIKKNSRHFAKRQLTYFRNQMDVNWYNITADKDYLEKINKKVSDFLR